MPTFPRTNEFLQSQYFDQMGAALPGARVFASDNHLTDAYITDPTIDDTGLLAGIGVIAKKNPDFTRPGMNQLIAALPTATTTAADFEGVVYRTQQMGSNAKGQACNYAGGMCQVMRGDRVGGRIWGLLVDGATDIDGTVYWIIQDTTNHGKPIGSFSGVGIGADTIPLTNARFMATVEAVTDDNFTIGAIEMGLVRA